MIGLVFTLIALQSTGDTVTYDVEGALRRGLEVSPILAATRYRESAASGRALQASAWDNPSLSASAENVGQQRAFTGRDGIAGLEGQILLSTPLPFGPERAGSIRTARAAASRAAAGVEASRLDVQTDVLGAIVDQLRDAAMAGSAREELETLERLTTALDLQAASGRASRGDAARASLARGLAATALARREAALAVSSTRLARLLGHPAGTVITMQQEVCDAPPPDLGSEPAMDAPTLRAARARIDEASGRVETARGLQIPDVVPQLGLRRSGGQAGLYLGVSTSLPLFDRGTRRIDAARADEDAARFDVQHIEEEWEAAHVVAVRTVTALTQAGRGFGPAWFQALEQAITASETRFEVGEGSLFELLDSRRARLQALDDYHRWQAEWQRARGEVTRLEGRPLTASPLCIDPFRNDSR